MAWQIKFDKEAQRALDRLDKPAAKRVIAKLREVEHLDNPRDMGKALTGNLSGFWRYRAGDYRILCLIQDNELVVLALDIDHRRNIYR